MIGVIAKLTVRSDMTEEFEKHAKALVANVNANEPDCYLYDLFQAKEGGVYVFMEKYKDQAALTAHGKTEYFLAAQAPLGACLAAAPEIEYYQAV